MRHRAATFILLGILATGLSGCAAFPDIRHQPTFHNPFPQLHRVAIIPFFNLSAEPTLDTRQVTLAYYEELQKIPGFEVVPPGVVERFLEARQIQLDGQTDFQQLARLLNVDAVLRGAVTEYSPYYPPRMAISVDWIAANPSFHPIPPGYGLPWGTPAEEYIPDDIVFQAEFALAREQLKTQTPPYDPQAFSVVRPTAGESGVDRLTQPAPMARDAVNENAPPRLLQPPAGRPLPPLPQASQAPRGGVASEQTTPEAPPRASVSPTEPGWAPDAPPYDRMGETELPADWPDPRGFVPAPPQPTRPKPRPQSQPIMTHTKLYDGADLDFTESLAQYVDFRDDARFGGWQGYLQRSDDFIRFCCYLHITETLGSRGGAGKSRVLWRWPIGRYVP